MSFKDDEQIVDTPVSGEQGTLFAEGKTEARLFNDDGTAPLEETEFNAMLRLTGSGLGNDRPGLDLVTVLDVSGSMGGEKIDKMKVAMQFVIKKLSPIDRLSVVTFSGGSARLCPLRQITEKSQKEIVDLVNALVATGGTNISAGLQTGLQVLNDRRLTGGRVFAIMLMSDGQQNEGDATKVQVGNVPVYTFGFGEDHDPRVLNAIAANSKGGTFSVVRKTDELSAAFAQCLAGLLTVVVQDLELTITPLRKTLIKNVNAGNYRQSTDSATGVVTVSFGNLYHKELRNILVELLLPAVDRPRGGEVIKFNYTYKSTDGTPFEAAPLSISVRRVRTAVKQEKEEVMIETNRLKTARMIKEARVLADDKKLDDAKDKLVEAQNELDNVGAGSINPLLEMLQSEVQQLIDLMKSQEMYEKQGRAFALSSETSHDRQRFAARGDAGKLRLFATPRMDEYLQQAKSFVEDPRKPLPTADEDARQEIAADPLAPIAGALSYYLQTAIQSLKAIENILNKSR